LLPQKPKIGRIGQRATTSTRFTTIALSCQTHVARRVDVGSACVDICQLPKTDVLVYIRYRLSGIKNKLKKTQEILKLLRQFRENVNMQL